MPSLADVDVVAAASGVSPGGGGPALLPVAGRGAAAPAVVEAKCMPLEGGGVPRGFRARDARGVTATIVIRAVGEARALSS